MNRVDLIMYLDTLLEVSTCKDYAPNGLQVAGSECIQKIVTGVTACEALIDAAIEQQADTILVHHGYFWKNESPEVMGVKQKRLKKLLAHDINLLAYHLPLDAHPELGNNAQLAKRWGLQDMTPESGLLRLGRLPAPMEIDGFKQIVTHTLDREPLHLPGGHQTVQTVAWCSGGAQHYIEQAAKWGADLYISGEVSEQTTHLARELEIDYFAAGHHATERYGVQALGAHLAERFDLQVNYVEIPNPV